MKNLNKYCFQTIITTAFLAASMGVAQADEHNDKKGSDKMMHSMQHGMEDMKTMKMSGDVDKDFAMMMKMHHQQGIEMAKIEQAEGKSPEMKEMAQKIISAQTKEIAELDKWLSKHK